VDNLKWVRPGIVASKSYPTAEFLHTSLNSAPFQIADRPPVNSLTACWRVECYLV
jgi:hypothetical protein